MRRSLSAAASGRCLLEASARIEQLERRCKRLEVAIQYAFISFSQVPEDHTVPPIVLHDCRKKLEEALK